MLVPTDRVRRGSVWWLGEVVDRHRQTQHGKRAAPPRQRTCLSGCGWRSSLACAPFDSGYSPGRRSVGTVDDAVLAREGRGSDQEDGDCWEPDDASWA